MKKKFEAIRLLKDSLNELESPKGSIESAIQKISRASLLIKNDDIYKWAQIQLGYEKYAKVLDKVFQSHLEYQQEKSKENKSRVDESLKSLEELGLVFDTHFTIDELNLKQGKFLSIGFFEERYNDLVRLKKGNDGTYYKNNLSELINHVKKKAHDIASEQYTLLEFSGTISSCFDILKNEVDDTLLDLNPMLSEQLMLSFKSVSSSNPEEWSQALTSCRRLLEGLADELFPAIENDKKGRSLGQGQYVNRLWAYMDEKIESKSNKELAKTHVDFLGSWLEKVNKLANKGVHAELSQIEAVKSVFHTYLVIADLLSYLETEKTPSVKCHINDASIDEIESLLDVSRTIAKEIFKMKIKEGYLTIELLSTIKGVGKKTLEKVKEEFEIDA